MRKLELTEHASIRVKILDLPDCYKAKRKYWQSCIENKEEIIPVFNRNGYYWDRFSKIGWIEIDGQAWINEEKPRIDHTYFLFEFELIDTPYLREKEESALRAIEDSCIITKKQKRILYIQKLRRQFWEMGVDGLRARKRFTEFKKKHGIL